jgi:ADP-heptose:LPS heptosyltransferase
MKRLLRNIVLLLVRILGAPGAAMGAHRSRTDRPQKPRILLIRPDHLGDLVLTTPVLQALRQHAPQAHITMMVGAWSSEVVARHPALDRLITCPFPGFQRAAQRPLAPYLLLLGTARQLRRERYDLAINLRPDFWWGAALLYLALIPRRVGYALQPGQPFLTHTLPFPPAEHATISNLRLLNAALQALNLPPLDEPYTPERYPLQFTPTEQEQQWAAERLTAEGIDAGMPVVVIHPGAGAPVKLWRTDAWANCARYLLTGTALSTPARIVLTGSEGERPMLEEIIMAIGSTMPKPVILTDISVGQLAALLRRACLVLGVDSGPLHLAVAQNTPTVRIFGPTDARIFGPWGSPDEHIVIASTQRCPTCPAIPCRRLDFSPEELAAHPCVRGVPEKRVEEAIATLLVRNVRSVQP